MTSVDWLNDDVLQLSESRPKQGAKTKLSTSTSNGCNYDVECLGLAGPDRNEEKKDLNSITESSAESKKEQCCELKEQRDERKRQSRMHYGTR